MWNPIVDENSSWFTFEYTNPIEQLICETIIRFATAAIPDLFNVDPNSVSVFKLADIPALEIVRLSDGQAQECYGIFERQRKFVPLTEVLAFEIMEGYDRGANTVVSVISESFHRYQLENEIFVPDHSLMNYDQFLPVEQWELFETEAPDFAGVTDYLIGRYPNHFPIAATYLHCWTAPLSFAYRHELLEVRFFLEGRHHRIFVLIDYNEDLSKEISAKLVDGSSAVIHDLWEGDKDDGSPYFALDTPSQIEDYLRFFCWAVAGDNGHFLLPKSSTDLPWTTIRKESFIAVSNEVAVPWIPETDNKSARFSQVLVAYGEALFRAKFEVFFEMGGVTMLDDLPVVELPLKPSALLKEVKLPEVAQRFAVEKEKIEVSDVLFEKETFEDRIVRIQNASHAITVEDFSVACKTGSVTIGKIDNVEPIDFSCDKPHVIIKGCVFMRELSIVNFGSNTRYVFEECLFKGGLNARDAHVGGSALFSNCIFVSTNPDSSPSADFHNFSSGCDLTFSKCCFAGLADFSNLQISGNLGFFGCLVSPGAGRIYNVYSKVDDFQITGEDGLTLLDSPGLIHSEVLFQKTVDVLLKLDNAVIRGNLDFGGVATDENQLVLCNTIMGGCSSVGIEVRGAMLITDSLFCDCLNFMNACFKQDVTFSDLRYEKITNEWILNSLKVYIYGFLSFKNCHVGGSLDLKCIHVQYEITLYGISIDTYLDLFGVYCHNDLNLVFAEIKGVVSNNRYASNLFPRRKNLEVGGNVIFSGAEIYSVRLEGAHIGGGVEVKTGRFHGFTLSVGSLYDGKRFVPVQSEISENIEMTSVTIQGSLDLSGVRILNTSTRKKADTSALLIESCVIGGNMLFFQQQTLEKIKETLNIQNFDTSDLAIRELRSEIFGTAKLKSNSVGGRVDLRNTVFGDREDRTVMGSLILDDTTIRLDLKMNNFHSTDGVDKTLVLSTFANSVSFKKLSVDGNIYLSSLEIDTFRSSVPGDGDFIGIEMMVKGGLFLIADVNGRSYDIPNKDDIKFKSRIAGNFDISVSTIKEVSFTEDNFSNGGDIVINMERAQIDKLRIVYPTPQNIRLSGLKVNVWDFGDQLVKDGKAGAYISVFEKMKEFDKSIYIDVERDLRNRNEDREADLVYRAMKRRARTARYDTMSSADKILDLLYNTFTKYGTNFKILLYYWLGLVGGLTILLYFFHIPIISGSPHVGIITGSHIVLPQQSVRFSFGESLLFAAQHCIPLFDLKFIDGEIACLWGKWVAFACSLLSYILLTTAIFGISARISRVK